MKTNMTKYLEHQKKHFANHVATLNDYGNIKVLDFKNPNSYEYAIRFLFEEDTCRLHISGDLGNLTASNYRNMVFEHFGDFVHNIGYFTEKIDCHDRNLYRYDHDEAVNELKKRLEDAEFEDEYCSIDDKIDEIMEYFDSSDGLDSNAYDLLHEIDQDCFEYFDQIGRESSGILELYMLAFELAVKQLNETESASA